MDGAGRARELERCKDKRALIDQIRGVISMIGSIHNEELESVLRGDYSTRDTISRRLQDARELKSLLIDLLRRHIGEHSC